MENITSLKMLFKFFCFLIFSFYLATISLYAQTNTGKLLENLYSENKETREDAAKKLGSNAIQPLISIIQNKLLNPPIRVSAIDSLAEIRATDAQPYLIETLTDELPQIRRASVESLKKLEYYNLKAKYPAPTITLQKLILMLKDPDPRVRITTIRGLLELCTWTESLVLGEVVPHLISMTDDPHPEVRMIAVSTLGSLLHAAKLESFKERLGDLLFNEAMSSLLTMLKDKEEIVVHSTLLSLDGLKFEEVKLNLINFLKNEDVHLRTLAIENLSAFEDKELIVYLTPFLENSDEEIRKAAKEAINRLSSSGNNTKSLK